MLQIKEVTTLFKKLDNLKTHLSAQEYEKQFYEQGRKASIILHSIEDIDFPEKEEAEQQLQAMLIEKLDPRKLKLESKSTLSTHASMHQRLTQNENASLQTQNPHSSSASTSNDLSQITISVDPDDKFALAQKEEEIHTVTFHLEEASTPAEQLSTDTTIGKNPSSPRVS